MSDLVFRLRHYDSCLRQKLESDAADQIERLQQLVEQLQNEESRLNDLVECLRTENERLSATCSEADGVRLRVVELEEQLNDAVRQRNEQIRQVETLNTAVTKMHALASRRGDELSVLEESLSEAKREYEQLESDHGCLQDVERLLTEKCDKLEKQLADANKEWLRTDSNRIEAWARYREVCKTNVFLKTRLEHAMKLLRELDLRWFRGRAVSDLMVKTKELCKEYAESPLDVPNPQGESLAAAMKLLRKIQKFMYTDLDSYGLLSGVKELLAKHAKEGKGE